MKVPLLIAVFVAGVVGVFGQLLWWRDQDQPLPESRSWKYCPKQVSANGSVEGARPEIPLRMELPGRLATIYVHENEEVRGGAVLAELKNHTHKHQVSLAAAELAQARADLEKLRNGERQERRKAIRAVAEARRALYLHSRSTYERSSVLMARNATSRAEWDADHFKLLRAEAEWEQAKAELALIEAPPRAEDVAAAEGRVAAADARFHLAKGELAKTRLLAPSPGRILRVFVEPGEMADPASPQPLLILANLSKRRVRAFVEELDSARVKVGQKATVMADAFAGKEFAGLVAEVLPRMGKRTPQSDAPGEYKDVYFREVLIDLVPADELPIHLRVRVQIRVEAAVYP